MVYLKKINFGLHFFFRFLLFLNKINLQSEEVKGRAGSFMECFGVAAFQYKKKPFQVLFETVLLIYTINPH
jgi:hypothetical protein